MISFPELLSVWWTILPKVLAETDRERSCKNVCYFVGIIPRVSGHARLIESTGSSGEIRFPRNLPVQSSQIHPETQGPENLILKTCLRFPFGLDGFHIERNTSASPRQDTSRSEGKYFWLFAEVSASVSKFFRRHST